ncbi:MAG: assimilatory sulfite reductase (NADPH) hemoprotein subunit [Pseudomonadota bacterium]|nr:MAG: assimilatory sulfite reductase (NADPH) hemoprotein subunit [Pseudomonadota bacterium]
MISRLDIERLKADSRGLRGTLKESLQDPATGAVAEADTALTKFHGLYQQDDRERRAGRRQARLEPLYQFMLRLRIPGGVVSRDQWRALDAVAGEIANGTIRLTTRQTVQFHGVAKENLRTLMRRIDSVGLDSMAACGDVNRNVMCHIQPEAGPIHEQTLVWARRISAHLLPGTRAWREIWIDGERVEPAGIFEVEPLYGTTYLPRKFKIGIALPPVNDIDVFSQDLGFIAIAQDDRLEGFNVVAGGGMGCTPGEPETYPRLGNVIGFVRSADLISVAEAVATIQRDFGDRGQRRHARFKYTLEQMGIDHFRRELEWRARTRLEPARAFVFEHNGDRYGWIAQRDGRWQLTMFVENGRLLPDHRAALGEIIERHAGDVRLTPNQNLVITGVAGQQRAAVDAQIAQAGLGHARRSSIRIHSMACVALPTCGLAMAEAERYLPDLITLIEELAIKHGLGDQPITVRMSGCPNGCSRPYLAEIGLVGRAIGRYNLYLGAAFDGSRLNRLYLDNADEAAILAEIDALFARYGAERGPGEAFGDFLVRAGIIEAVEHGSQVNRPGRP